MIAGDVHGGRFRWGGTAEFSDDNPG
jgi:hypothetical protein